MLFFAARLTRTVIIACALSLSVFVAIGIGFGFAFAFAFVFAFVFALAVVGACGCAARPPTEAVVWRDIDLATAEMVCNFFLDPQRFTEKASKLEAARWIFLPIDWFDFNWTQMNAVGISL